MCIFQPRGQNRDRIILNHTLWGDSFVLIYSITDRKSFNSIMNFYQSLCNVKPKPVVILMANKSDLEHKRKVLKSEGTQLAELMKCPLYECSAADGFESITQAFHDLYHEVLKKKKERKYSLSPRPLRSAMGKLFRRNSTKANLLSPDSLV
ncbi:ras-related and estrogen-regulated growth inhibitor-like [Exaiptasia diaphana]|uniref:small monomeric GTPase n=1 Tax=Exaiptasia diaphana TaxID=2652724 RepID=A0A913WWZ1_EXADI|nr:ras-related and estrogen-regulated growth inhibitor-like [Exaiptasia diaphana]